MPINSKKKVERLLKAGKKIPCAHSPLQKQKKIEGRAKRMEYYPTAPENAFAELLTQLKINWQPQKIVNGKIFDFYDPDTNTLFEVDGSYWHGYGLTLQEMNDIQRKAFHNDKKKDSIARSFGYKLIRVWEHELEDEMFNQTKEKIRGLLK